VLVSPDRHYPMERDRSCPFLPPPAYKELRETEPITKVVLYDGREAWFFTRYDDVRAVLSHPAVSAETLRKGFPFLSPGDKVAKTIQSFQRWDDPRHAERRRLLAPYFTVKRVEELRSRIRERIQDLYADLEKLGPPLDLYENFALALPSAVACELLGVPYEDHVFFESRFAVRMDRNAQAKDVKRATEEVVAYLDRLVREKYGRECDDLFGRFVNEHVATGDVTHEEAITDCQLLLLAGHETTANMIALGVLALITHPEQLARIQKDPSMIPGAVEELLRYLSISQSMGVRIAKDDFEIGGVQIKAGDGLIVPVAAANYDDAVFPGPERLDLSRPARNHLTFGAGVHQCLGQQLARVELQEVYSTVFDRFRGLRLAIPFEEVAFKYDAVFYGVYALPVTWDV
jgi:cytochrome P450